MISLARITVREWLLEHLFPQRAAEREARVREALAYLDAHPEEPCMVEGIFIPDGYQHSHSRLPAGSIDAQTITLARNDFP
jgi:hypothetical protein